MSTRAFSGAVSISGVGSYFSFSPWYSWYPSCGYCKGRSGQRVRYLTHCWAIGERFDQQYVDDPVAEPAHSLLRSYVPTRVALWFLLNGLFGDLRRPCNWTLVFVERSS